MFWDRARRTEGAGSVGRSGSRATCAVSAALALFALVGCGGNTERLPELFGLLEAAETEVRAPFAGELQELLVREGDRVEAGQPLAKMASRHVEAEAAVWRARVAQLQARVDRLEAGAERERGEIQLALVSAEENIRVLEKNQEAARASLNGIEPARTTLQGGVLVRQESDYQAVRVQILETEIRLLEERLQAARADLARWKEREASLDSGEAREARAALDEARARQGEADELVERGEARAPHAGIVSLVSVSRGEDMREGQMLLSLGSPDEIWAQVYVDETRLGEIHVGQRAKAFLPSGAEVAGQVQSIDAEGGFATQRNVGGAWRDLRTFGVKVALANIDGSLRPGMSVRVQLEPRRR